MIHGDTSYFPQHPILICAHDQNNQLESGAAVKTRWNALDKQEVQVQILGWWLSRYLSSSIHPLSEPLIQLRVAGVLELI